MPRNIDRQKFRNEDLILMVNKAVDRKKWDENKYEAFLDELCGDREYQKEAIRNTLRYLLCGEYSNLRDLAKENYEANDVLKERYGSWQGMERHLQLPEQLSCSLDLATGVGKSYVLYGLAAIFLAEGTVDRVLVLCPSTTIEDGLIGKFRELAGNADLRDLLPEDSKFSPPRIINASESITEGSICVENYHAILEHVGSSIRDSLKGKGARVAVLNDETHHVANELAKSEIKIKRWKEFLLEQDYGFRYVVGVSGTCYIGDDYFADVIYRYSLRQAMEENRVKKVDYVAEMPQTADPDEKWQLIYNRHEELRKKLNARKIRPLSIIVTPSIKRCEEVAEELKSYLVEEIKLKLDSVEEKILVVHSKADDVSKLPFVDQSTSKVEWIVSVSMLNEGWDVKRVFQIVPHEEKAFNSKLLIAQVLGRGLRIPDGWKGTQPEVTVFNHDSWAPRIRHLVAEILEIEKRLSSNVVESSSYHFKLHNIDYTLEPISVKKPMTGEYALFTKGYVDLATDTLSEDVSIEFEKALTGDHYKWKTRLQHKSFSAQEIAEEMFHRLEDAQDSNDPDLKMRTVYTDRFPIQLLEELVKESLSKIGAKEATESMKQKFLQSLGTLRRKESENVRYKTKIDKYITISTKQRQSESVSSAELRNAKTLFFTDQTRDTLVDEQLEFFDEASESGSGYKIVSIQNRHDFKTPLNTVIADSENERKFIKILLQPEHTKCYDAWLKSTATRFYEIDYAWKKGEHPKRGKFNPDIFIKIDNLILVIEIKGDEELREPSEENKKKNEHALAHFTRVNDNLKKEGSPIRYKFIFLSPQSYNIFFQTLREGKIEAFKSELDVKLAVE
jgi:type III restriction enzyme